MTMRIALVTTLSAALVIGHVAAAGACPPDSVRVGRLCIDKYPASVWQIPTAMITTPAGRTLLHRIQTGTATLNVLTNAGAVRLGASDGLPCSGQDYGTGLPPNGNWQALPGVNPPTPGVYAVSIPGTLPSLCATWFQAEQACLLSGKRLLRNHEWQGAAAGAPASPTLTSNWGVTEKIGSLWDWTAEWHQTGTGCMSWPPAFGGDASCMGGGGTFPGSFMRGGFGGGSTDHGLFTVANVFDLSAVPPSGNAPYGNLIFRCARDQ